MELIRALLYGISAQRPLHSIYIGGEALPLEARMGGIFLGFLLGLAYQRMLSRFDSQTGPEPAVKLACGALIAAMALDGANAFLHDGGVPTPYAPATVPRLLTGLGAGYALALLAAPISAGQRMAETDDGASGLDGVEFLYGLGAALLLGGVILLAPAALLWPISLLMVASVIAGFAFASGHLLRLASARFRYASGARFVVPAVALALAEIVALAMLRSWLASALGFSWGV